ncbi:hypothetical protein QNN11_00400 [Phocaeicola dorei]|uniref:RagB/SusD family nutrient uptake outer membrane protein n=1 Tax=Phocaeicola dorei TaxID=357276 RepID=A0AA95HP73_9BACT|nr:hypothetical protein QNN11_00400 [Phocaeicola dorei]
MNKLYKWCLLSCMAATLSSCNDFLTEENPSGLTADTFYKTESGAEALINSCYTPLRFWYGQEYATSMTELGTDIFTREMVVPKLSFPIITRHYKVPAMR